MRSTKIVFVNGSICPLNNTIPDQYIGVLFCKICIYIGNCLYLLLLVNTILFFLIR